MNHRTDSKISKVRSHLLSGNSITPLHAIGLYAVFRLAADIDRLRNELPIITTMKTAPNAAKYAEYALPFVGMEISGARGNAVVRRVWNNHREFSVLYEDGTIWSYDFADAQLVEGVA